MRSEVSALLDDELAPDSAGRTLDALRTDPGLRDAWETYHLIGDALRRSPDISTDFSDRVMTRLSQGPVVLAPQVHRVPRRSPLRYLLPLAASVMGMGAVGWVAISLNAPQSAQVAVATPASAEQTVTATAPVQAATPVSVRPAAGALQEYLIAHQAYSPSSGMQGVAPYARTISEFRQDGRR